MPLGLDKGSLSLWGAGGDRGGGSGLPGPDGAPVSAGWGGQDSSWSTQGGWGAKQATEGTTSSSAGQNSSSGSISAGSHSVLWIRIQHNHNIRIWIQEIGTHMRIQLDPDLDVGFFVTQTKICFNVLKMLPVFFMHTVFLLLMKKLLQRR